MNRIAAFAALAVAGSVILGNTAHGRRHDATRREVSIVSFAFTASLTADPPAVEHPGPSPVSGSHGFTVTNTGNASGTATLSCTTTTGLTCSVHPSSRTLAVAQSAEVDVDYTVTSGTYVGFVYLTSSSGGAAQFKVVAT